MTGNDTKCLVIADFNGRSFAGHLANSDASPRLQVAEAPFDQVTPLLLQADHECWSSGTHCAVVWTRPERVSASFARALAGEPVAEEMVLAEVDAFCDQLSKVEGRVPYCFIPTWVLSQPRRGLGVSDLKGQGIAYLLARMNLHLMQRFSASRCFFLLDSSSWFSEAGKFAYSPKSWFLAKTPFGNEVFARAAREVKAALRALSGKSRKLVVVDLDGTIWGGIVGEVGWENLVLGGHHAFGEAFADFQRELKALRNRGVVLAIASKNEETIALEAIAKHPEMVLKKEDFAAWRINWNDKAANIADLVVELNLGMDSVVFLDDNPAERNRVREALPQVLVPDLPEDKMLFASLIRKLDCFDSAGVSEADRSRTQMYQSQREREALRAGAQSFEDWLEQLQTRLLFEPLNEANQDRALQLLNKTNQMNLSTRRLSDSELKAWAGDPQNHFWTLRVTDRFGDAGLVGLMSLAAAGKQGQITDFILSCRVMGRRIEEAMLRQILLYAEDLGIDRVVAEYLPTAKNAPCLKFFESAGGDRGGNRFAWQPNGASAAPTYLVVQEALA